VAFFQRRAISWFSENDYTINAGRGGSMESSLKLLIIDDDQSILNLLENYLTSIGYDVVCTTSSLDGLKQIEDETNQFDLIITDLIMPDISGIGLISILKKDNPQIPIIAITGKGAEPEKLSMEAKADAVLQKPFEMSYLKKMISELLSQS
jgi:DNA-binding response OmpR family regulator